EMYQRLVQVHSAIVTLQDDNLLAGWKGVLGQPVAQAGLHGLIAARASRLLFDQKLVTAEETGRRMGLALAPAVDPAQATAWIESFLRGSGLILLHNEEL